MASRTMGGSRKRREQPGQQEQPEQQELNASHGPTGATTHGAFEEQRLPVRVYEGDGRVMVAAPMPGLEPQDISVAVEGARVTIHGALRGPRQDERKLSVAEWAIGPYHRELSLPQPVDGTRANATYGNGVLVLALPKASRGGGDAHFTLDVLTATRGARVGHAGRDLHKTTAAAQGRTRERNRRASP